MLGIPYTISDIAQASLAKDLFQGRLEAEAMHQIAFDTRHITQGYDTLFVALKTGHRDGHDFISAAYSKGVRNFIVDRPIDLPKINYALVDDTLEALQSWAMFHRQRFTYPVLAITGSNGKTTVKEWLATLLEAHFQLVKSPMSYNSQLGVAVSLLQLYPQADFAIIEAGISQRGEMEVLAHMIQPTYGLLTHMGSAHADGFLDEREKLQEKLLLFEGVERLWVGSDQPAILKQVRRVYPSVRTIGTHAEDQVKFVVDSALKIQEVSFPLGLAGEVHRANARLAIGVAHELGMSLADIAERVPLLHPVSMRSEIISDNPEVTILNDSYNSDLDSTRLALRQLAQTDVHDHKWIILSDIPHLGEQQVPIQQQVLAEIYAAFGEDRLITVGPVFARLHQGKHFRTTEDLLKAFEYEWFRNSTVLLKGARSFALEALIPRLNHKLNATSFRINLSHLSHNFRYLKTLLPEGTKTMCMVKAASYGAGTWEIAQQLEKEGATYLAVAYASEGIELREAGIRLPIMVMNPDPRSIEALLRHRIEPEVSNMDFLQQYVRLARLSDLRTYRIHLKLETGMGRLGFRKQALQGIIDFLSQQLDVEVVSVMSHLAASDVPAQDSFSRQQIALFQEMYQHMQSELGLVSFRHILNTSGILRFAHVAAFEMVRPGIGLYGINPTADPHDLLEIGTLASQISQIQTYAPGTSIGYGRSQHTQRSTRIATLPIGYADGIPRAVGNGQACFMVQGQLAPTFGRICMDMLMLDVTDVPEVQVGDEVVVFGEQAGKHLSINTLAKAADTIPYEILVRISPRVRRVYVRE